MVRKPKAEIFNPQPEIPKTESLHGRNRAFCMAPWTQRSCRLQARSQRECRQDMQNARGSIGALIIRIGFGGQYTIIIIRNPQNSIGNCLGPYSSACKVQDLSPPASKSAGSVNTQKHGLNQNHKETWQ